MQRASSPEDFKNDTWRINGELFDPAIEAVRQEANEQTGTLVQLRLLYEEASLMSRIYEGFDLGSHDMHQLRHDVAKMSVRAEMLFANNVTTDAVSLASNEPRFSMNATEAYRQSERYNNGVLFEKVLGMDTDPVWHGAYQAVEVMLPMLMHDQKTGAVPESVTPQHVAAMLLHCVVHDFHEGSVEDQPPQYKQEDTKQLEDTVNRIIVNKMMPNLAIDRKPFVFIREPMMEFPEDTGVDPAAAEYMASRWEATELLGYYRTQLRAFELSRYFLSREPSDVFEDIAGVSVDLAAEYEESLRSEEFIRAAVPGLKWYMSKVVLRKKFRKDVQNAKKHDILTSVGQLTESIGRVAFTDFSNGFSRTVRKVVEDEGKRFGEYPRRFIAATSPDALETIFGDGESPDYTHIAWMNRHGGTNPLIKKSHGFDPKSTVGSRMLAVASMSAQLEKLRNTEAQEAETLVLDQDNSLTDLDRKTLTDLASAESRIANLFSS